MLKLSKDPLIDFASQVYHLSFGSSKCLFFVVSLVRVNDVIRTYISLLIAYRGPSVRDWGKMDERLWRWAVSVRRCTVEGNRGQVIISSGYGGYPSILLRHANPWTNLSPLLEC